MKTYKFQSLNTLSRLRADQSGNLSVFSAVTLVLILLSSGAAIDMGGMTSERSRLQEITDTAALAAAASRLQDEDKLKGIIDDVMVEHNDVGKEFTYSMKIENSNIVVTALADYDTQFMKIFGRPLIPIKAVSGAPYIGSLAVNLALVVDTTDSMQGDNLESLQDAASELIDTLKAQKSAETKMSVVPFGNYVNVGMSNRNAAWMDVPHDYTYTPDCYKSRPEKGRKNCRMETETRFKDGVPYDHTRERCDIEYEDFEIDVCPSPREIEWKGCAGSREAPYDIQAAAARGITEIPGAMGENCGSEVLPMTTDLGDVQDVIDNLSTSGSTYLAPGLLWGWRTMTEAAPFENKGVTPGTARAMVFMTDGGNTMNVYDKYDEGVDSYHREFSPSDNSKQDQAIGRMLDVCDGIKADGITIYTIGYKVPDGAATTGDALVKCASSPSTNFSAESSKELKEAFKSIANNLSAVRLKF